MSKKSSILFIREENNVRHMYSAIFINKHLSHNNRRRFVSTWQIKRGLHCKFFGTKNGSVYLRKDDATDVIEVTNDEGD